MYQVDLETKKVVVIGDIVPFQVLESVSKVVKNVELSSWNTPHECWILHTSTIEKLKKGKKREKKEPKIFIEPKIFMIKENKRLGNNATTCIMYLQHQKKHLYIM